MTIECEKDVAEAVILASDISRYRARHWPKWIAARIDLSAIPGLSLDVQPSLYGSFRVRVRLSDRHRTAGVDINVSQRCAEEESVEAAITCDILRAAADLVTRQFTVRSPRETYEIAAQRDREALERVVRRIECRETHEIAAQRDAAQRDGEAAASVYVAAKRGGK